MIETEKRVRAFNLKRTHVCTNVNFRRDKILIWTKTA